MKRILMLVCAGLLLWSCKKSTEETQLKIVSAQMGGAESYRSMAMRELEGKHPGLKVVWDDSAGDDYEFAGLPSMLAGNNPPDIYFEWGGARVTRHIEAGEALDISSLLPSLSKVSKAALAPFIVGGKLYGIPENLGITNMLWYDTKLFAKHGWQEPKTWEEFLSLLRKIKDEGITPLQIGNSDLWTAGNFMSHIIYRVAGDQFTRDTLSLRNGQPLDNPDFVAALEYVQQLAPYVNPDANTLGYEESASAMFTGEAAIYPIGNWFPADLIPLYSDNPAEETYDFFNLPPIKGAKGHQNSVMGVSNGFQVNSKTPHPELAKEFLASMLTKKYQENLREGGAIPVVSGLSPSEDKVNAKVAQLLSSAEELVIAPDVGYRLEVAEAIYKAIAQVIAPQGKSPREALQDAEASIARLRS